MSTEQIDTDTNTPADAVPSRAGVPEKLPLNTPRRFYRGGERIFTFRGLPRPDDFDGYRPEDWIASTTRLFAEGGDGLTHLSDGADLRASLDADPEFWLGPEHVAAHGSETGLLTKLLDSGERLPVHSHPDRAFAAAHLDCDHGKTEAWIVLVAEPGATVHVGFRRDLGEAELAELVQAQDERLLEALNAVEVSPGDAVLVPAGTPHAIGEGILVLELQEPTDFSVMLEHERFGLEEEHAFLGLERPVALQSVERSELDDSAVAALRTRWDAVDGVGPALPEAAAEFFRAEVIKSHAGDQSLVVPAGFAVLVVVDGAGELSTSAPDAADVPSRAASAETPVAKGDVILVPHAAGLLRVGGDVTIIRCMPPGRG